MQTIVAMKTDPALNAVILVALLFFCTNVAFIASFHDVGSVETSKVAVSSFPASMAILS